MKKFPAPKKEPLFVRYWDKFLPKVVERDNFHHSHLEQLEILCDLYLEYHVLSGLIKENGYTFTSDSRYGLTIRENAEVKIRQKIISEIRQYSKILGLLLAKDTSSNNEPDADEWE
jgi:phage terminase small subunit